MASHRTDDRYRPRPADRRIVLISRDGTRTITVRPWVAGLAATLAAVVSIAYLGATAYLIFRDDLIGAVVERNAGLQQSYEDRIASLRSEIDKIASRQILDQVAFDDKVDRLIAAHRALDDRSSLITRLIERARENGVIVDGDDHASADDATGATGYAADDAGAAIERRFAALMEVDRDAGATASIAAAPSAADVIDGVALDENGRPDLRLMSEQIARIDAAQTEAVHTIASAATAKVERIAGIVSDLGIALPAPAVPDAEPVAADAVGGPFVPLAGSEALASALAEADAAFGSLGSIRTVVARIPLAEPVSGATRSSNFGSRTDPFLGSAAFHAGVDFRAPTGRRVTATGAGRVVAAGRAGGYGNMVEIDHGKGISTRYAHLSRIDVEVGEEVAVGDVIGRVGSTGRSTGPHLHYETRIRGTAVNPSRYLDAGRRISALMDPEHR
jgi:murein DD-endopeptidase MepM/ murein hydrolase activator NlpD